MNRPLVIVVSSNGVSDKASLITYLSTQLTPSILSHIDGTQKDQTQVSFFSFKSPLLRIQQVIHQEMSRLTKTLPGIK